MSADLLFINATILTKEGSDLAHQAVAIKDGLIDWCGDMNVLPREYQTSFEIKDCQGQLITPGLIDCHTHLIYAGNRADEYKKRLNGLSYAEIASQGGGILSTVNATRKATEKELVNQSLPRLLALRNEGVTTVEIKSGYGLDLESELKILKVAKILEDMTGLKIKKTFLGAHALAPEYKNNQQAYVDLLCEKMIPKIAKEQLADAVDVFCENIAFSRDETEQIFKAAIANKLAIKCHAEQLSNLGASALAASYHALSCDHLEHLDEKGAKAMAESKTVAVLLPGAFYFLREKIKPPIALLRHFKIPMAIATDSNPGTSPTTSLLLMLNMACQFFELTVEEALKAVTINAAKALSIDDRIGSIEKGKEATLILWSTNESANLCYYFGYPIEKATMVAGKWLN